MCGKGDWYWCTGTPVPADTSATYFYEVVIDSVHDTAELYFGFVQLSTFCQDGTGWLAIPGIRDAQLEALTLPRVGFATAADWGGGCNIHCPDKEPIGTHALHPLCFLFVLSPPHVCDYILC